MFAAPVGVDRAVEADIGGFVTRDDAPRRYFLHFGRKRLEFGERLPAVIGRLVSDRLVAARAVGLGAAAMPAAGGDPSGLRGKALRIGGFSKGNRHAPYDSRSM